MAAKIKRDAINLRAKLTELAAVSWLEKWFRHDTTDYGDRLKIADTVTLDNEVGHVGFNGDPAARLHIHQTAGTNADGIRFTNGSVTANIYTSAGGTLLREVSGAASATTTDAEVYVDDLQNAHPSAPYGLRIRFTAAAPDDNVQTFLECSDIVASRCVIYADGDLANHDNSYGAISDERLKQDIVPASSQWEDIKQIGRLAKKYRFKADVAEKGDAAGYQLGVIAQEVERISPGLVQERPDMERVASPRLDEGGAPLTDGNGEPLFDRVVRPTGATTKSVQYSVLYMKAVKALSEAMERIERLEARFAVEEGGGLAAMAPSAPAARGGGRLRAVAHRLARSVERWLRPD